MGAFQMDLKFLQELIMPGQTKIAMIIMDGLGGLPLEPGGKTELETAATPNLDALAAKSELGLTDPVGPGITVESGPGHLALFGYDPLVYRIGRGVLEAIGIGIELGPNDVAVRGNYCSVDATGVVTDRRAGRIPTEVSRELSKLLSTQIEDVTFLVETVREHRLSIVLRGPGLSADVSESDPQKNGYHSLPLRALAPEAEKTARVVNQFVERARQVIEAYTPKPPANMLLMRGFDNYPNFPAFPDLFGLHAAAIAVYPTYRGIAKLVGMQLLSVEGSTAADEFTTLEKSWNDFDFFYLHIKDTDLAGEDGNFARKVNIIEEVDRLMPRLMALDPDVIIISGDHSTPAVLKGHSWHPVPTLVYGKYVRADGIAEFGERACRRGSLGILPAKHIMPIALANAQRLAKYSA
jgi:2,3-bisphosphoglycerate-independent phosphoglycerate mutase